MFSSRIFSLFTLIVLGMPGVLRAQTIRQRSSTEGLSLGVVGHVLGWSSDYYKYLDENSGSGFGGGLRVGYGLSRRYEVFAEYDYTSMDVKKLDAQSFTFSHLTGGLRVNFSATTHAFRPYLEAGYAYRTGKVNQVIVDRTYENLTFKGGTFHVGGGLSYFITPAVALTLNGAFQGGGKANITLTNYTTTDKADATTFRVGLGLVLYPAEF